MTTDPIFIVGYMHSGTSMLQHALGSHSELLSTRGETKYFDFLPLTRRRYADLDNPDVLNALIALCIDSIRNGFALRPRDQTVAPVVDEAEVAAIARTIQVREHAAVFGAVMDHLAASEGKRRWLEKTPTHIFAIDRIIAAIPAAKFVEIIRDPRDVLASKKTRRETVWTTKRYGEAQREWKHLEKAYDPLWDALSWKAAARAGLAAGRKHADRCIRVRYEDLVRDPEGELRRVCAFLGLPFEPAMLDVPAGQPASEQSLDRRTRGVSTDSVSRWRTTLSPAEVAVIQSVTADELEVLGYTREPTTISAGVHAIPLVAHSAAELFVRLRRRQQMGGAGFLSLVLTNYARRARRLFGD